MKLSENLKGALDTEFIKNPKLLTKLTIPAGVTSLNAKSLTFTEGLKFLTIIGEGTTLAGDSVFNTNTVFPPIKAKATSKAAEFAKANGYTFIDLDTGEETKGTKPAPSDAPVVTPRLQAEQHPRQQVLALTHLIRMNAPHTDISVVSTMIHTGYIIRKQKLSNSSPTRHQAGMRREESTNARIRWAGLPIRTRSNMLK